MTKPEPVNATQNQLLEWTALTARLAEKQQELWQLLARKSQTMLQQKSNPDPMNLQEGLKQYFSGLLLDPEKALKAQLDLGQRHAALMQYALGRMQGENPVPIMQGDKNDRRFRDLRWTENPLFDYIRQSYLLNTQWWQERLGEMETPDDAMARKLRFAMRQYTDAMSPSNFWLTNPEVLDDTLKSKGENLLKGMDNLISDLKENSGRPKISMVKKGLFEVGKNLAMTPGKVVYQNELIQIIQYSPSTEKVFKTPLVIISPWINKYYILDMQAENSFVKWCVDQGHTVFISSWANATSAHKDITFADYMTKGLLAAIETAQQATGEKQVNVIGYCIGGTLLATLLAYWKARGEKSPVKSATFFTAMIDFEDAGELTLFTDEAQIAAMEEMMAETGYLDAWHMHTTFNMLRANDLIWSFVVNNYLLGREPFPFDLLHWNSDSVGIPGPAHSFYLRQMYLENNLAKPGKMKINNTALDVAKIDTPSYFISTIDDHIAPWKATYRSAKLLGGKVTFTLAGSGHIAGVVNHPGKNKYHYWVNDKLPATPEEWLHETPRHEGSWWVHWAKWMARYGGAKVAARIPGKGKLKAIEDAPGSYVKVRAW
ncbi:MAG: class poly(R)-hydroxyalkanoic acid synthase [Alphaproteobacteria bacterium]|nr:class poly(R)-hydroxyalkanoic acid synthase [Alphaproteobacteria bacterium]